MQSSGMRHLRIWRGSSPTLHQSGAVSQILPRNLAEISLSDCKDGCSRTMFRLELSPFVECSELTEMLASVCGCLPALASGFERLLVYCAQSAAAFVQFARTGSICDASSSHRLRKARPRGNSFQVFKLAQPWKSASV
mgnify:FL=1